MDSAQDIRIDEEKKVATTSTIELDSQSDTSGSIANVPVQEELTRWRKIVGVFWDTAATPIEERGLVNRLDAGLLIYVTLSYVVKSIDASSIGNAYFSGMQEELGLYGNEYNLFSTFFNVGSIAMAIPMQMITFVSRPSIVVPICEIFWTIFTIVTPACHSARQIYALRFLVGASQAICYPVFAMMVSSWYKPSEMAKRMLIYDGSWAIASICSGYIMAGIYATMNGAYGVPAWKWMFYITGIMSFPVGIAGFFCIPDFPNNTRALYLTADMKATAIRRMEEIGRVGRRKMTWNRLWSYRKEWRLYAFTVPYSIFVLSGASYMNYWLQKSGYSVEMINILPTITAVIGFVMAYVYGVISDIYYCRWQLFAVAVFFTVLGNFLLAIWDIPDGAKFFAYYIPGFGGPYWGLVMSWAEEVMYDDAELRGFYPAFANAVYYAMGAWIPNVVFPNPDAPEFIPTHGYWVAFAVMMVIVLSIPGIIYYQKYDLKKKGLRLNHYNIPVPIEFYDELKYTMNMDTALKERGVSGAVGQKVDRFDDQFEVETQSVHITEKV
ncbi:major facilitator superfamily domain-containing protein [Lipomyces arxii]|uniref:major facilitator superfamily domain-containing protein n=1 Tax=Lipomyces arxii TaxID=56418 RepID=UPI0034CDBBD9